ncbi:hypothetical protein COO60DRAFT_70668 [Scenedesmus sp. NREL 46B-D3]|nr:hypothetical protein COO60DRAFT_70668 [Scenedesmus sp. NREL 46B-D3]
MRQQLGFWVILQAASACCLLMILVTLPPCCIARASSYKLAPHAYGVAWRCQLLVVTSRELAVASQHCRINRYCMVWWVYPDAMA